MRLHLAYLFFTKLPDVEFSSLLAVCVRHDVTLLLTTRNATSAKQLISV